MADLLTVKNLRTCFHRPDGIVNAVNGISYSVGYGETLGIVGESGSGKSVSVLSLLKLLRSNARVESGEALLEGKDLLKLSKEEMRKVRGKEIAMIFQNPMTCLNPTYRIGRQMIEPLLWHKEADRTGASSIAVKLLQQAGIPEASSRFGDYPFQFSGGMRQRVMIAMALTCNPKLLIADEPTTALDVTVRSQILNLLQEMKAEYKMSVIIITHDFGIATNFCDKLIVMYAGRIVESAPTVSFVLKPQHPYSKGLLRSTLDIDLNGEKLKPIPGNPPSLINLPSGCAFHPRCEHCTEKCRNEIPELKQIDDQHSVACHMLQEITSV